MHGGRRRKKEGDCGHCNIPRLLFDAHPFGSLAYVLFLPLARIDSVRFCDNLSLGFRSRKEFFSVSSFLFHSINGSDRKKKGKGVKRGRRRRKFESKEER